MPKASASTSGRSRVRATRSKRCCRVSSGRIAQMPPRHAALKYQGRNYYEYAREGIEIPRVARAGRSSLELALRGLESPDVELRVRCGKGTYVRVLAEDIGAALRLRRASGGAAAGRERRLRPRVGAVTLDALERCARASATRAAAAGRCARCDAAAARSRLPPRRARLRPGQAIDASRIWPTATYRVYAGGAFLGVGAAVQAAALRRAALLAAGGGHRGAAEA